MTADKPKVENLSFEDALEELEGIVEELESGQVELEQMLERFERAMALRERCAALLSDAETRIEQLVNESGDTEPLTEEDAQSGGSPSQGGNPAPGQAQDSGPDIDWTMEEDEDPFGDR